MAAVSPSAFRDHLFRPDGPYTLRLAPCPACGEAHEVALSRIGRFMFRCGRLELSGLVDDWPATRHRYECPPPRDPASAIEMGSESEGDRHPPAAETKTPARG